MENADGLHKFPVSVGTGATSQYIFEADNAKPFEFGTLKAAFI